MWSARQTDCRPGLELMRIELGTCRGSDDEFLGRMSFRSHCISPLPIGMPPWKHTDASPVAQDSQRDAPGRDIATGVLVVGEFGEKATIPRRLHLLNNDHVRQPPPSAL